MVKSFVAPKVVDAMAKLPSAALTGNLFWAGSFSECIQTAMDVNMSGLNGRFTGMYCMADVQRQGKLATAMYELSPPVIAYILREASLKLGVCIPSSCSIEEVQDALKTIITDRHDLSVSIKEDYCQTNFYADYHLGFFLAVIFVSIWCALILLSTLWDISNGLYLQSAGNNEDATEETDETLPESPQETHPSGSLNSDPAHSLMDSFKAITANMTVGAYKNFSIVSNLEKLTRKSSNPEYMTYLDGIRVINMGWIILGHVYSVAFPYMWDNIEDISNSRKNISFHIVISGLYAVDSFFFVTGYLATIRTLQKLDDVQAKQGRSAVTDNTENLKFIIKSSVGRYARLTPNYFITILLMSSLGPFLGYGPLWPQIRQEAENCSTNWWKNVLYISNFVSMNTMCQPHCWYLAVDMQLWGLVIVMAVLMCRKRTYGVIAVSGCIGTSLLITAILTAVNRYPSSPVLHRGTIEVLNSYYQQVYIKPYCRLTPVFMGILAGSYVFHKLKCAGGLTPLATVRSRLLRWFLICAAAAVCFAQGLFMQLPADTPSLLLDVGPSLYGPLTKLMWGIVMALFIVELEACRHSPINRFLSSSIFLPLLRLTYWAFLLHYGLLLMFFKSRQEPTQFDHWVMADIVLGLTALTYVTALLCFLVFEMPVFLCVRQLWRSGDKRIRLPSSSPSHHGIEDRSVGLESAVVQLSPTRSSSVEAQASELAQMRIPREDRAASREATGLHTVDVHSAPNTKAKMVASESASRSESPVFPESGSLPESFSNPPSSVPDLSSNPASNPPSPEPPSVYRSSQDEREPRVSPEGASNPESPAVPKSSSEPPGSNRESPEPTVYRSLQNIDAAGPDVPPDGQIASPLGCNPALINESVPPRAT